MTEEAILTTGEAILATGEAFLTTGESLLATGESLLATGEVVLKSLRERSMLENSLESRQSAIGNSELSIFRVPEIPIFWFVRIA